MGKGFISRATDRRTALTKWPKQPHILPSPFIVPPMQTPTPPLDRGTCSNVSRTTLLPLLYPVAECEKEELTKFSRDFLSLNFFRTICVKWYYN